MAEKDMKEKLLDLIIEAKKADPEDTPFSEFLADFLLAYGVTIQERNDASAEVVRCKECRWFRPYKVDRVSKG